MRILLVEDDPDLSALLIERLQKERYIVDHSPDGEEGLHLAETGAYAAIVLDVGLPKLDGLVVTERLRQKNFEVPVLLLTARDGWRDRVAGLRLGADDYIGKPFETEELLARLEALIRRSYGSSAPKIKIGDLTLDFNAREVLQSNKSIHLTPSEYRALSFLAMNAGKVVDKITLAEQIWQEETSRDLNAVEVIVGRLRKKIGTDLIRTKRGHGYVIAK
ncbi:MAG: response regulator transcription factor [Pseudomonadota bacterium]